MRHQLLNIKQSSTHESGFVLVSVIWIAGLLAVMATAFTIGIRSYTLAGRNVIQGERAQAIADGMVMLTAYKLASEDLLGSPHVAAGAAELCQWSTSATVSVTIQDQGGLVDLNTASPPLIDRLLEGLGFAKPESEALQATIRDYRDPDYDAQTGGSEPTTYPGRKSGPKNGPFSTPEELDQIPGMTEQAFATLARVTTVSSQQMGIDVDRAPVELRQLLGIHGAGDPEALALASPSPQRVFAIDAAAELTDGSRFTRHALIALLRQPDRPFAILGWQQRNWIDRKAPDASPSQPCLN